MKYQVGDTVEVISPSAFQGEVATVEQLHGCALYLRFEDTLVPFLPYEVKQSQYKLEIRSAHG